MVLPESDVSEDVFTLLESAACEDVPDDVATLLVLLLLIALLMTSFEDCTESVELGAAVLEVSFVDCTASVKLGAGMLEVSLEDCTESVEPETALETLVAVDMVV